MIFYASSPHVLDVAPQAADAFPVLPQWQDIEHCFVERIFAWQLLADTCEAGAGRDDVCRSFGGSLIAETHEVTLQVESDMLLVMESCKSLLKHLERAAKLANNTTVYSTQDGRDTAVEAFLENSHDLLDPAGIEERIKYSRHVENNLLCIETSYTGHLFVNEVAKFQFMVRTGPQEISKKMMGELEGDCHKGTQTSKTKSCN